MAFDRNNLVGVAGQSKTLNNQDESKADILSLEAHVENAKKHVSIEDRKRWDETYQKLKDYVDYRFKSIIGVFDFEEIGLSNKLTLAEIVLTSNKDRIADVTSLKGELESKLLEEKTTREKEISDEVNTRISDVRLLNEKIDDVNARIDQEIQDRISAVAKEERERTLKDNQIDNNLEDTNRSILSYYNKAVELVEKEALTRDNADQELQSNFNIAIGKYDYSITDLQNIVNTYTTMRNNDFKLLQDSISSVQYSISREIVDRKSAVSEEATFRINQYNTLDSRIRALGG